MYNLLRRIKKTLSRIRFSVTFPLILKDYIVFLSKDKKKRFSIPLWAAQPILFENTPFTRFDTHYIYHTAWAARKVKEINASFHVDISSSLYFSSIVSAFKPVRFFDYRPAKLNLSDLTPGSADLLKLPFETASVESLSCMHTVEHVGLGRYGDPIDPDGDIKAAKELSRVVKEKGDLLFVVPIGKPRIEFNAHRVYSYDMVLEMFPTLKLKEFSLIPDNALSAGMVYNATKQESDLQNYGCGCFWFTK
jgi:predicted SAM-dependent methyltransferase